jgi:hypothetical protein
VEGINSPSYLDAGTALGSLHRVGGGNLGIIKATNRLKIPYTQEGIDCREIEAISHYYTTIKQQQQWASLINALMMHLC